MNNLDKLLAQAQTLSPRERRQLAESLKDVNGSAKPSEEHFLEMRWLSEPTNREKYGGQWVALRGEKLLANGPVAREVYAAARAAGMEIPFVEMVDAPDARPFIAGWL